jgi:sulfite reductase (NADPH) flavoprotein alpha-component
MTTTTDNPAFRTLNLPQVPVLPATAPFNSAQRAWLNGFFAGLLGAGASAQGAGGSPQAAEEVAAPVPAESEHFPWHDPALPMAERLKLADGKPRDLVMMAAMAQLDCGACGYECRTYARALDRGEETDATRCSPGGAETAKKLKELLKTLPAAASAGDTKAPAPVADAKPPAAVRPSVRPTTHGRDNPFPARLRENRRLNLPGSEKDTRHVALDLTGSGLTYKPGDALGVYPENCPTLVEHILEGLDASGAEDVAAPDGSTVSLREALLRHYSLTRPTPKLFELLKLRPPAEDGPPDTRQVLDLVMAFEAKAPRPQRFVECLSPLQPRLYSIASSLLAHPDQVHLTVGVVRYVGHAGRGCKGVCSTYLAERIRPGQKVRVFVHPSRFGLPANPDAPVIMVGPGTGVAPFRSFLQHRRAARHPGRNWLLFGDQRSRFDFLYESELKGYAADGTLTRLDTAFSRDGEQKLYVQHRMIEHATELWGWITAGGHFYVCGDAKRMAADVDQTLRAIVAEQGRMGGADADAYVNEMARTGRYQRDVY